MKLINDSLKKQIASLQSQLDHLESELGHLDEILKECGFPGGIVSLKSTIAEFIEESKEGK